MNYDNVQLWFAKDENNNITTINKVNKNKKHLYYCPLCGSRVIVRQGKKQSWCFAHIDKTKCNSESMYHWWFKNKFLMPGDKFIIKINNGEKEYMVKDCFIEKEYKMHNKIYKPDITILTTSGQFIYFEMNYSNEKKIEDYINSWIELNNIVVEIDIKTLMNCDYKDIRSFKALYYNGKCFNIKNKDKKYYNYIGKYKEQLIINNEYNDKKIDIEKLDWFWKDIQKYKLGEKDFKEIIELIQAIEDQDTREVIVSIFKNINCNQIVKDYINILQINFNKKYNQLLQLIDKQYLNHEIKIPHKIYDRLYFGIEVLIKYKDYCIYDKNYINDINFNIEDLINKINKREEYLKIFAKRKIIFDKIKNYKFPIDYDNLCDDIIISNIPNMSYYYSYYDGDRLYLNNFKNTYYGEYISVMKCESERKIKEYISERVGDVSCYFNKIEVIRMNNFVKKIKEQFTTKYIKIKAEIYGDIFIMKFIMNYSYKICETIPLIHTNKVNSINIINNNTINNIKKIFQQLSRKIIVYKYINAMNKKYKKYTQRKWHINIELDKSIIEIKKINKNIFFYHSKYINEFLNNTINIEIFKKFFADELSDQIRNYIYK